MEKKARKRIIAPDSSLGERATAIVIPAAMKAKRAISKIGGTIRKKKNNSKRNKNKKKKKKNTHKKNKSITLKRLIKSAKNAIEKSKPDTVESAIGSRN